jgi:hypothetical protein
MGTAYRGLSLTALGQAQEGLTLLTQGLTALRATGTVARFCWFRQLDSDQRHRIVAVFPVPQGLDRDAQHFGGVFLGPLTSRRVVCS